MVPLVTLSTKAARVTLKLKTRGAHGEAASQMSKVRCTRTSVIKEPEGLARPPGGLAFLAFSLSLIDIQLTYNI